MVCCTKLLPKRCHAHPMHAADNVPSQTCCSTSAILSYVLAYARRLRWSSQGAHELGALYAVASAGSERDRAVALAGGDAAFMRESQDCCRLAAQRPGHSTVA